MKRKKIMKKVSIHIKRNENKKFKNGDKNSLYVTSFVTKNSKVKQ